MIAKKTLILAVLVSVFVSIRAAKPVCNSRMYVDMQKLPNKIADLDVEKLSSKVQDAIGNSFGEYWLTISRSRAVHFCKAYARGATPLEKLMEVKADNHSTKGVWTRAINSNCKEASKASLRYNKRLEIVAKTVAGASDEEDHVAIVCAAYSKNEECHVYRLLPKSLLGRRLAASRELQGSCAPDGGYCVDLYNCCSRQCHGRPVNQCYTDCFPSEATVLLESGVRKTMAELRVGDRVQVVDTATGQLAFSDVYTFMDKKKEDYLRSYHKFTVVGANRNNSNQLQVSDNHFVYAAKAGVALSQARLIHAKYVQVGDTMWLAESGDKVVVPGTVVDIEIVTSAGAYAPQTLAGCIVVDGVLAHGEADLPLPNGKFFSEVTFIPAEWYHSVFKLPLRTLYRLGLHSEGVSEATRAGLIASGRMLLSLHQLVAK